MRGKKIPAELIKKYSDIAVDISSQYWGKNYKEKMAELEQNRENFFEELAKI
jgi:hypothetical protein